MARKKQGSDIPTYDAFFKPVIQALIDLGGSGSIEEINARVYDILRLPDNVLSVPHGEDGRTEVEYRLAWTRTYLKKAGLIDNSSRGVWSIVSSEVRPEHIKPDEIQKKVKEQSRTSGQSNDTPTQEELNTQNVSVEDWKDQILNQLYQIQPAAFERLAQRLLRESGFIQVE
ncbi:MAG TPA: winged helix-turn-helix domain-containing protein, partial [Cytophagales bacterium]